MSTNRERKNPTFLKTKRWDCMEWNTFEICVSCIFSSGIFLSEGLSFFKEGGKNISLLFAGFFFILSLLACFLEKCVLYGASVYIWCKPSERDLTWLYPPHLFSGRFSSQHMYRQTDRQEWKKTGGFSILRWLAWLAFALFSAMPQGQDQVYCTVRSSVLCTCVRLSKPKKGKKGQHCCCCCVVTVTSFFSASIKDFLSSFTRQMPGKRHNLFTCGDSLQRQ